MVLLSEISSLCVFNDFLLQKAGLSYVDENPTNVDSPKMSKDADESLSKAHEENGISNSVFHKTNNMFNLLEEWEEHENATENNVSRPKDVRAFCFIVATFVIRS